MKKILNKRVLSCILALFLIPAFLLTLFAGCADDEETADTYTVTVVNGTGGGEFEEGETATITATVPNGQTFVAWTEDGEVVSTENPYTFEVTGNVTLTATFSGEDTDETYTVTVENGTGGGEYEEGETATVTAATDQGTFSHWEIGGQQVSTDNPYTFTVTGDVTITAVFKNAYTVTVTNGTVTVGTAEGSASGTFDEGTEVTIAASKGSHNFVRWENAAGETLTYTQESFTYEVTANATFVAVLTKTVTVSGGTISGTESATSGEYEEGETVTVVADTAAQGTRFVGWRVGDSTEIVSTNEQYTYTVGDSDVTITAVYVNTYTVTVSGGTLSGGGTSGTFDEGTEVTVTANEPAAGQAFSNWTDGESNIVSTSDPYTFEVTKNITLTANYSTPVQGDALNLNKSTGGNPIGGFGIGNDTFDSSWTTESTAWQEGDADYSDVITYGGDPAVMVVEENGVETAYLYVGHDITTAAVTSTYTMPEWICYSSTDLVNWTCEGIIMDIEDIPWARGQATGRVEQSAWASQVIEYQGHYWFFFCSWSDTVGVTANQGGSMSIGVAVSDDPTGPFKCYNQPLVYSTWTSNQDDSFIATGQGTAGWNDIDPTGIVTDTDGDGQDEFYIAWGNSNSFMAQVTVIDSSNNYYAVTEANGEFTKDTAITYALEIVDQSATTDPDSPVAFTRGANDNGAAPCYGGDTNYKGSQNESDWDIIKLDLWRANTANNTFTEAPYLYEREVNGKTRYYMIYAAGWREALAYSVTDTLWQVTWEYGNRLMDPTATSNTNHPAVFDFGGKTYMIYHNGSLPYGCGYRRVPCIAELEFSDNGYINFVCEYSTGLDGVASKITQDDTPIGHLYTVNSHDDAYYPINLPTFWKAESSYENGEEDAMWEIEAAKYVPEGEDANYYVSIQAYNMAGLYLTYDLKTGKVVITQDDQREGTAESDALQARMSFKTVAGENGIGVMFQCAADSDYYLAIIDGELVVTNTATAAQCTFRVQTQIANRSERYAYNEGVTVAQN